MTTLRYVPAKLVLTVTDFNMPDVNLAWDNLESLYGIDVTKYEVYRTTDRYLGYTQIGADLAGTVVTYADSTVVDATLYYYKVKATILTGGSLVEVWSNEVSATTFTPGLTQIYIGGGALGGFIGLYALDANAVPTPPPTLGVNYFYDSNDFVADRGLLGLFYEGGYLHTTCFNARPHWWTTHLATWTRAKPWTFIAGPASSGYSCPAATPAVGTDMAAGGFAVRTLDAGRTAFTGAATNNTYGGTGTTSNNTVGSHAVDSSGRAYWVGGAGLHRCTIYPTPLNDHATLKATIQNGFSFNNPPIALHQDGAYALVLQQNSSDGTRTGNWLHVIRTSDGNMVSLDLNTVANTYNVEHEPIHISVKGNLAFVTRADGGYQDGVSGTRNLVYIIDLTNPDAPTLASTLTTTTNGQTWVRRVVVYGNYIYFVVHRYYNPTPVFHTDTWIAYDITNPASPVLLDSRTLPTPPTVVWNDSWVWSPLDEAVDGGDKGQIVV